MRPMATMSRALRCRPMATTCRVCVADGDYESYSRACVGACALRPMATTSRACLTDGDCVAFALPLDGDYRVFPALGARLSTCVGEGPGGTARPFALPLDGDYESQDGTGAGLCSKAPTSPVPFVCACVVCVRCDFVRACLTCVARCCKRSTKKNIRGISYGNCENQKSDENQYKIDRKSI